MTILTSKSDAEIMFNMSKTNMFKPIKVGDIELSHRLAYAPSTRLRNTANGVPTDSVLEYYKRRAHNNGGLLIMESCTSHPSMGIFGFSPSLYHKEQIEAFKKIVEAVHKEGSHIGVQICDLGRVADPVSLKKAGYQLKGPSAVYATKENEQAAKEAGNELKEMTKEDIQQVIRHFAEGAKKAIKECGFDFVEIHGAHGFLVDSFLQESANFRKDEYGGSIENKSRFVLELVDACIKAVGAKKLAIRISPYATLNEALGVNAKVDPSVTWGYLVSQLQKRADEGNPLAYISIVEPRVNGIEDNAANENIDISWFESTWKGIIFTSGNHLDKRYIDKLPTVVDRDDRTIIGASRYFTSNPDLPNRLKNGYPLTPYHRDSFYVPGSNVGYLNFTNYGEEEDHSMDNATPVALA